MSDIDVFMAAIRRLESGSYAGNYSAVGVMTQKYGRARGAYQIMETIWPGWAAEAGIPGASYTSKEAQDHVARFKMNQYYERYGSWDLVAIAWFAGPGAANQAMARGVGSLSNRQDALGTSVPTYVNLIQQYMTNAPEEYGTYSGPGGVTPTVSDPNAQLQAFAGGADPEEQDRRDMKSTLIGMLDSLSNSVAGGAREAMAAPVDIPLLGEQQQQQQREGI